jgi:hypothetical protein
LGSDEDEGVSAEVVVEEEEESPGSQKEEAQRREEVIGGRGREGTNVSFYGSGEKRIMDTSVWGME